VAPHALGEQRQDPRVQPIGLGQEASGAGEVADLARIDHGCRDALERIRADRNLFPIHRAART
jgi:hypothetical protein